MLLERKQDLSVYYFIKDLFSGYPTVKIVDGFPVENLTIPTISVEAEVVNILPGELGNRHGIVFRVWYVEIFAENKSQRDEIGYTIIHALENNIPVYDYDQGFPPSVTPARLGGLVPEDIKMEIIKVFPQLVEKLYYRATVSFVAYYDQL